MDKANLIEQTGPIVATAETAPVALTLADLDGRIRELEATVAALREVKAQGEQPAAGRKTVSAAQVSLLAKAAAEDSSGVPLEAALSCLSLEQRFAVKSGLLRAGLLR